MTYITGDNISLSDWEVVSDDLVLGATRDRMSEFHLHRTAKVKQLAADTEKIALKMEKLSDGKRSLTKQLNVKLKSKLLRESSSGRCSGCDTVILVMKKKCKLCDATLCHKCVKYTDFDDAKEALLQSPPVTLSVGNKRKKLRLCAQCDHLVDLSRPHAQAYDIRLITQYDQMKDLIDTSRHLLEVFCTTKQTLLEGETTYLLTDTKTLRERLGKMAEGILELSRRIAALPATPGSRHARLQDYIRMAATLYVKEHLLSLQMPTQLNIDEAQQKRFVLKSARYRVKPNKSLFYVQLRTLNND